MWVWSKLQFTYNMVTDRNSKILYNTAATAVADDNILRHDFLVEYFKAIDTLKKTLCNQNLSHTLTNTSRVKYPELTQLVGILHFMCRGQCLNPGHSTSLQLNCVSSSH